MGIVRPVAIKKTVRACVGGGTDFNWGTAGKRQIIVVLGGAVPPFRGEAHIIRVRVRSPLPAT